MRGRSGTDGQAPLRGSDWAVQGPGRAACLLLACVPLGAAPGQAWAQAATGAVGSLFAGGDLRGTVEALMPTQPQPNQPQVNTGLPREWTTRASLGLYGGITDNPGQLNNQNSWTLLTVVQPSIGIVGDTPWLSAQAVYAPQVALYSSSNGQNRVSQNLNAAATAVIVPDHLFLDARAYASDAGSYIGDNGVPNLQSSRANSGGALTQVAGVSVTPYYQQRFGGWGTLKVGYSFSHVFEGNQLNPGVSVPNLPGFGTRGDLTTGSEFLKFSTGENLDRFNYTLDAVNYQYSGGNTTYSANGNYRVDNNFSYALSHAFSLLSSIGFEKISYGGLTPFRQEYLNWTVGGRIAPNGDSFLSLRYGDAEGGPTVLFNGRYQMTPRVFFYGNYNTSISTNLQRQQALLQNTLVGPNGIVIDSTTGLPVSVVSPFGILNAPARVKELSFGAGYLLNRDVFSVGVTHTTSTTVTQSSSAVGTVVPTGTNLSGAVGTLGWQHDIDPITSLSSSIGYGVSDSGAALGSPGSSLRTLSLSTVLSHSFTETLQGTVSYSYYDRSGISNSVLQGANSATQNVFLVGLHKTF
jgi:hypothetical protein